MADVAPGRSLLDRLISVGKDLVALLRDGALVMLAILLLLFPAKFNDLLVRAGFEEGSIVGFKWKANLLEANDALKNAQVTIADLKAQLDKANEALSEAQGRTNDPALRTSIAQLEAENTRLTEATRQVEASVRATIASNEPLVEKAQASIGARGGWGVVFGSDVSVAAARDEIARATRKGIEGPAIYYRNGYYASIAVVDSRSKAQEYLEIAKTFRPDAYIVSMATWCRNPQPLEGFTACPAGR